VDVGNHYVALDHDPKAIFLSFGEIRSFAPQIRRAGIPLIAQIQTVAQAKVAVSEGAEFIVAQGTEAGGHGGTDLHFRSSLPSLMRSETYQLLRLVASPTAEALPQLCCWVRTGYCAEPPRSLRAKNLSLIQI
jgi:NAD(P)H-dependent flavin oxidoreductase YrpB (nitropropane dioxygenase family)